MKTGVVECRAKMAFLEAFQGERSYLRSSVQQRGLDRTSFGPMFSQVVLMGSKATKGPLTPPNSKQHLHATRISLMERKSL
jgi:hypothetical protein